MATPAQIAALIVHVGGREGVDDTFAEAKFNEAAALVDQYVGETFIPPAVLGQAYIEVASKLWLRRSAPLGVAQFDTLDGNPIPTPRDPLVTVYPTLNPFLAGGFS